MFVSGFDISDQNIEEKLRDGKELWRVLFENSYDAILLTSFDGTIYAANPIACQIFGMTEEEIVYAGRSGIIDISNPKHKLAFEIAMSGKFKGELNFRRKDGTIFSGELTTTFFSGKNGLMKTVMIIKDFTECNSSSEIIRESEERYNMLFTNMTDAFFLADVIYDKDGKPCDYRFLEINPAYEYLTGLKKEQLLGKTMLEVFPNAGPIEMKECEKVILCGSPTHYEVMSFEANSRNLDVYAFSPEKEKKLALILRDITEKKQSREALRKAHDNLEEKIIERTAELEKAYSFLKESEESFAEAQKMAHIGNWNREILTGKSHWSDELYRIFGLNPQESEANYALFLNYVHPDDRNKVDSAVKKALNGELFDINYKIILASGSEHIVHAKAEVVFDEKNIPIRMRGTVQDITDRKQMERALLESEEKYRNIVETANEGIFLMDADFTITYANMRTAELMGYTLEEIIGRPVMNFIRDESKSVAKESLESEATVSMKAMN